MKAYHFVIFWIAPMLSWAAFMFLLYFCLPFGDLLEKYNEYLGDIGGESWDNRISEIVIFGSVFINCIFIWCVAKFIIYHRNKNS
ncbi:hypothetical protein [Citrobacter braakii]|uniref:hypothetical protein n=1 Tax=Citrobacter braakii TaxID=57706 RepID=UPI001908A491|nr:hypothetical protein [Citrobacter braakii]MBJ9536786.1 hypothetical protein [Citrobacter braakii]MBJ9585709.1 hypothetical protein [Citrobacter braakii]